jgi:hypothetical protein
LLFAIPEAIADGKVSKRVKRLQPRSRNSSVHYSSWQQIAFVTEPLHE